MSMYNMLLGLGTAPSEYTFDPSLFLSPFGNGVYSQPLTVADYFSLNVLPNGSQFRVTGDIVNATWDFNSPYSWILTKGTDVTTSSTPYANNKQFFMRAEYYSDVLRMYGFYSGGSTSFPNGQVTITKIELL